MAGHSKWANIKRAKGATDAKRGKVFAKLSREVTVAAKLGGGDPDMNPRLRMVLLKCRAASMPKDNIDRAIQKAKGGGADANFEELVYEIYAPGGVAILAEITTDNRNRAAAEVRSLVTKAGGSIAAQGAVSRLFQKRGQIIVARQSIEEDPLMELALEAGADDFRTEAQGYEILTTPSQFESVHQVLESKGISCEAAEVTALADLTVPLREESQIKAVSRLLEALEDHDDVQAVYSNAEFPPEQDD
jgi:YebC/PmpR family DNA-binding regulatory protein